MFQTKPDGFIRQRVGKFIIWQVGVGRFMVTDQDHFVYSVRANLMDAVNDCEKYLGGVAGKLYKLEVVSPEPIDDSRAYGCAALGYRDKQVAKAVCDAWNLTAHTMGWTWKYRVTEVSEDLAPESGGVDPDLIE